MVSELRIKVSLVDFNITISYKEIMKKKRTFYNTTLDVGLLKALKILAVEKNKRQNDLLEEAIKDLLKKYGKKVKKWL